MWVKGLSVRLSEILNHSCPQPVTSAQVYMSFWGALNGSSEMHFYFTSTFSIKFTSNIKHKALAWHQSLLLCTNDQYCITLCFTLVSQPPCFTKKGQFCVCDGRKDSKNKLFGKLRGPFYSTKKLQQNYNSCRMLLHEDNNRFIAYIF